MCVHVQSNYYRSSLTINHSHNGNTISSNLSHLPRALLPTAPHPQPHLHYPPSLPSPSSQENIKSEIALLLYLLLLSTAHLIGVQQPRNTLFPNTLGGLGPLGRNEMAAINQPVN